MFLTRKAISASQRGRSVVMKPYYQKTFNRTALLVATLLVFALATVMPGQTAAETPIIVEAPTLDRDANLVINGSFEEGHPGTVAGPSNSPSEDSVYWALVDGGSGTHNPANRGDLSLYPDNVEMTPPGWTGSGGLANYAEWSSQWPGFPQFNIPPTGPALSTAPSEGEYSLYFGNFYMTSMDIPQDQMTITADGEWIFRVSHFLAALLQKTFVQRSGSRNLLPDFASGPRIVWASLPSVNSRIQTWLNFWAIQSPMVFSVWRSPGTISFT
jgi:hypothetical protein